jgi:hypothetical protein
VSRERELAQAGLRQAQAEAAELAAQRDGLSRLQRAERRALAQAVVAHEQAAQRFERELARADRRDAELRAAGRHPDQWVERDGRDAVRWAAAEQELAVRREFDVRQAQERAVTETPAHVREAIGSRPQREGAERDRWDQLARDLERHRLEHDVDVSAHGALGPAPAQRVAPNQRQAVERYAAQRPELTARIRDLRADRGMDVAPTAPGLDVDAPDMGAGR